MRMIDTHCHLNFQEHFPDPLLAIDEARAAGVDRLIVVGCDTDSSKRALDLAHAHEGVYAVVGWHPTYTKDFTASGLDAIEAMLEDPKAVAIGEIGLDFHWDYATPEQQYVALEAQLDLATRKDAPIVFHCRKAYPELLEVLERRGPGRYLFHCFSGTADEAKRALALNAYFGFDGPITYKNAGPTRDLIKDLPRDRVLIETDSPYMPPEPHRGKPNKPAWVALVNAKLASVWGVSVEDAAAMTTANAERFFPRLS